MIELERKSVRGDPDREAKAWLDKLSEVDRKRSKYQEMAAEGLITFSELREKLAGLEVIRETAEHELDALKSRRERLEQLERDKDALLETYTQMAPEALEALTSEERHQLYKMLQLKVLVSSDGTPEITGAFGGPTEPSVPSSVKKESSSMSVLMVGP